MTASWRRSLVATQRNAFAESWANRRGFWTQVAVMVANDLVWVVFWVVFFRRVGSMRGWDVQRVLLLQAVLTTGGGIALGVFANARKLGELAADGGLDAVLALPVATLPHLLVRRIHTTNLGDMAFGVLLFAATGHPSLGRTAIYFFGVVVSASLLVGFLVATGSLAFFVGRNEGGDIGFQGMILLGSYPAEIFTGGTRFILYTIVPAAFVASVPARLIDGFDPPLAAAAVGIAAAFVLLGWLTFRAGLRRYTSGAYWTRA
jgi:ABC-2 type transport system permease protein